MHFRARVFKRNTRREAPNHPEPAIVTTSAFFGAEIQGDPRFRRERIGEALFHDSDDRETLSIDLDTFSENIRVGSIALFPQRMAQNNFLKKYQGRWKE